MVYCRGAFPAPNCWEGLLRGGRLRTGLDGRRSGSRIRGQAGKAAAAFAVGQGRAGGLEGDMTYVDGEEESQLLPLIVAISVM